MQTHISYQLSTATKALLAVGGALLLYDFLCHAFSIYFFWESGVIGWFLLLLGAISFLLNRIDSKSSQKKDAGIEKGAVFLLAMILIIRLIVFGIFASSDAFEVSSNYLKTNERIRREVGPVSGVVLLSEGGVHTTIDAEGEQGAGTLNLIAKGQIEYKQFELHVLKKANMNSWQVVEANAVE